MDEEIKTIQNSIADTDEYADALDAVPEDVRAFLWSDAFTFILKAITETYKLTPDQAVILKRVVMGIVTDTSTPISRQIELSEAGISGELQENILQAIDDEIISRILTRMDFENEVADAIEPTVSTVQKEVSQAPAEAPTPLQALAMIKDRLAKPTVVTPTKRDHSDEPLSKPAPQTTGIKNIDPYREVPEK